MKIFIEKRSANTGKGKFLQRLAPELEKLGANIVRNPSESVDIYLDTGKFHCKPRAKKWVLRLGSPHFNAAQDIKKLNRPKKAALKRADGVVYQSKFVKKACHKYLGKCKNERVIYNGADPMFYIDIKKWPTPFTYNFCAVTRKYIKQKRLKDIIRAFQEANIHDSCLYIVGEVLGNEKKHKANNIQFLGSMDDRQVGRIYRACIALVHMCYLDACPNSAVEAICAGIPVITGDQGGAPEISTHQIKDKKWNFKPIDLEQPPKVNRTELANVMNLIAANRTTVYSDQVQIKNTAHQYMEFFREVQGKAERPRPENNGKSESKS